jgi:hypothetical protein
MNAVYIYYGETFDSFLINPCKVSMAEGDNIELALK